LAQASLHLILYTSPLSRYAITARRNCDALLDRLDRSRVNFEVCDVSQDPDRAAEDAICFTPTLVRRHPLPRMHVMGELSNIDVLADLLDSDGAVPIR
jgi:hypothetical protein